MKENVKNEYKHVQYAVLEEAFVTWCVEMFGGWNVGRRRVNCIECLTRKRENERKE